jgi:hypothetical protein
MIHRKFAPVAVRPSVLARGVCVRDVEKLFFCFSRFAQEAESSPGVLKWVEVSLETTQTAINLVGNGVDRK